MSSSQTISLMSTSLITLLTVLTSRVSLSSVHPPYLHPAYYHAYKCILPLPWNPSENSFSFTTIYLIFMEILDEVEQMVLQLPFNKYEDMNKDLMTQVSGDR